MRSLLKPLERDGNGVRPESLTTYLSEIGAYRILSREEEIAIVRRARAGDREAIGELINANLRFVVSMAKRYRNRGVDLSDLISEGNLALVRAARRFDETRDVKFISYAVWFIRQALTRAIEHQANPVRTPLAASGDRSIPSYLSLDDSWSEDSRTTMSEIIEDMDAESAQDRVAEQFDHSTLHDAVASLNARQVRVLEDYFGLNGHDPITLDAIAVKEAVTRERVRQIKAKALSTLRNSTRLKAISQS